MPTKIFTFDNPGDFIFNPLEIEVASGARLVLQDNPGQDFTEDFDSPVGFIFDPALVDFSGSEIEQIDQRPANSVLGATFTDSLGDSWAFPDTTITTLRGAPVHASGQAQMFGYINAAVIMENSGLGNIADEGAVKQKHIPNYSGTPAQNINIFELSNGINNNNKIIIFHSASGGTLRATIFDSAGVQIHGAVILGTAWSPVSGTPYEIEVNFKASTGLLNIIIDGTVKGSTPATIYTRSTGANRIYIGAGNSYLAANAAFDDLIIFDTAQHTTGYTPGYTVPETIYPEADIVLPEMEYTGAGALVSFDSFPFIKSGNANITLQIGRSGNYLYWTGASWAVSDGSIPQTTSFETFAANVGTLPVAGEVYGKFKIKFLPMNSLSSVQEITASLTAQIYPLTEPNIEPADEIILDSIGDIQVTASSLIKYVVKKNDLYLYYSGGWVASDKSFSEANTIAEILLNKSTLIVGAARFKIVPIFGGDGSTQQEITQLTIDYSSAVLEMQFVVEDGTGKSDSTSYATVIEFLQYWKNKGQTVTATDNEIKAWLNNATEYIDKEYFFMGKISNPGQSLKWPRIYVKKNEWIFYEYNEIPKEVKNSVCYLAKQLQTESEFYKENTSLKSYRIGPVSKTFDKVQSTRDFPIVESYLRNIVLSGNEIVRAN